MPISDTNYILPESKDQLEQVFGETLGLWRDFSPQEFIYHWLVNNENHTVPGINILNIWEKAAIVFPPERIQEMVQKEAWYELEDPITEVPYPPQKYKEWLLWVVNELRGYFAKWPWNPEQIEKIKVTFPVDLAQKFDYFTTYL